MAAAGNTLLDLGIGFLDSLLQDIFKGLLTDKVKNIIDRRNVERAIQRCAEAPGESLERFFRDERVDEPNAQIVLDEVKAAINAAKVDAAMLAAASINADKLTNAILDIRPAPPSITEAGLEWPYKMAIQIASDALCAIGPCMPEWERENWRRNFDVLDKISANQEKILASVGPGGEGSADERFERSYRSRMLTKLSSIDASTLRIASGICLDLPTLFVQPDVRPLPARSDVEACEEEGECLASLEETRKLFFSQADEGGSSRLSAERFVNDCTRCAIVGLPGTGKSTLLQHLLLAACSEQNSFLPVLVKARELAVGGFPSADDLLALAVSPVFFDARPGFIRRQFEAGRVMLLIDGLDEMTVDKRDELVAWLSDLIELYGNCKYIISSRPAGYQSNVFRNLKFTEVTLLEFSEDQIQEYVKRWSRAVAVAEGATQEEADSAGEQTAKSLLSSAQKNPYVRRLAHNPLLLSTLCLVQKYEGGELPHRRVVLYQRCVEGLLFHWDKKRGLPESILGSLTLDRKLMLLRRLAIEMQVLGVAEIREEDIRASFTTTLAQVGDSTDIELILENIRDRSGLLVEGRPAVY